MATGTVVSVMLGAFGIDWVLASMTGLAAGAFALAFYTALDPRFDMTSRQRGLWVVACIVILTPVLNLGDALRHSPRLAEPSAPKPRTAVPAGCATAPARTARDPARRA